MRWYPVASIYRKVYGNVLQCKRGLIVKSCPEHSSSLTNDTPTKIISVLHEILALMAPSSNEFLKTSLQSNLSIAIKQCGWSGSQSMAITDSSVARTELFLRTPKKSLDNFSPVWLSKLGLLLKERICSHREQILSFKSSPYDKWGKYCMLGDLYLLQMRNMCNKRYAYNRTNISENSQEMSQARYSLHETPR